MSKRVTSALPLLSGNAVLLFLLLAGGLFSFTTAYDLTPNTPVLLAGCCVLSLLYAVLWSVPRGSWAALSLLGLDVLAIWRLWDRLVPAVTLVWMALTGSERREPLAYTLVKNHAAGTLTPALLLVAVGIAFVLSWLAVRERCWHLPAVLVTIPLMPAFLSGVLPHLLPLTASAAGWGTLLLTGLYNRRDKDSLGKGVWMGLGGISALLLILLAALPREGYTRPEWATNARGDLIDAVNRGFSGLWTDGGGEGGNPWNLDFGFSSTPSKEIDGQVDLTKTGPRRYSNQTVLQIIGGTPGRTYLRGGASAHYTGSGWEPLRDEEEKEFPYSPALFPALTAPEETASETLTVKHIRGKGDTAYVPYRYLAFPDGLAFLSGDGDAMRSMDEYQIEYIPGGPLAVAFTPLDGIWKQAEQAYREFVYRHYMDVPAETEEVLVQAIRSLNRDGVVVPEYPADLPGQYQQAAYNALIAATALDRLAVYDLNVPQMEPEEDFVAHFLEEGRGYCVHFATAGAMLLRLYGIPARYVEGYAPLLRDGVTSVRDSDAHAWVEIYLDGYGWYPVEMTPGRQGETPDTAAPEILQTESPIVPSEEEDSEEDFQEEQEDHQTETPKTGEETDGEDTPEQEPLDFSWLWKTAAVLLALAAPYGGYRLLLVVRKKRREHPDVNRSVIYAYLQYRRLVKRGSPEEPELEELGRKAKFSQHQLTEEERQTAWRCADHAAAERKKRRGNQNQPQ